MEVSIKLLSTYHDAEFRHPQGAMTGKFEESHEKRG